MQGQVRPKAIEKAQVGMSSEEGQRTDVGPETDIEAPALEFQDMMY